ncbi:hypothetical protein [Lysobacter gummosus]
MAKGPRRAGGGPLMQCGVSRALLSPPIGEQAHVSMLLHARECV